MHQSKKKTSRGFNLAWGLLLLVGSLCMGSGLLIDLTGNLQPVLLANPGFNPLGDLDRDGIPNIADNEFYGSDPAVADSDGDGFQDGFELATGGDPYDFYSRPVRSSGTRILVAPDGIDVYLVFLRASDSHFTTAHSEKILFVEHNQYGPVAAARVDVTMGILEQVTKILSQDEMVETWTLKVRRKEIGLWSLGFGMKDLDGQFCNGVVIHHRSNDFIYTIGFEEEDRQKTNLEPTEPESNSGSNPGIGFKECEQTSIVPQSSSPMRLVTKEVCETREQYICPPDCGALAGKIVVDLNQTWLY